MLGHPVGVSDELLTHSQLGPYRLMERIGMGGVAEVYRAEHHEDHRELAIKVLHSQWVEDRDKLRAFEQEVELLESLEHPALPRVRRHGEVRGRPAFAMDLVPGTPVHVLMEQGRPVDVVGIFLATVAVVAYLHRSDVVHNDLKLENLLLRPDGKVVLVDFGNARRAGAGNGRFFKRLFKPKGVSVFGTANYLAPELLQGGSPTTRSDVYALGVCAWMLFTGAPPFDDRRRTHRLQKAIKQQAPSLRERIGFLPEDLAVLLDACLAKDPELRPENADALRTGLKVRFGSGGYPTPVELSKAMHQRR